MVIVRWGAPPSPPCSLPRRFIAEAGCPVVLDQLSVVVLSVGETDYSFMYHLHLRSDHPAHTVMGAAAPTPAY
jgi:hypothetical protein